MSENKFDIIISKLKEVQTELHFLDDQEALGEIPDELRGLIEELEQYANALTYLRKVIRKRSK